MKIVYISNSRTANSIHVMKMCQAFADNGHEVVLLAPDRYKEYENGVDDVYEFVRILKFYYKYMKGKVFFQLFSILKILQKIHPELVYGRYTPGCLISSIFNYKTIFESHSPIWHSGFLDKFSFEIMKKMPSFKRLVVISNALKNMYLENKYLINDKIQVAHDGADEVIDFENKVELLGDKNSLKVGYVGHLYKGRGIELIIECAKNIKDMTFHIVGGTLEDIMYWKKQVKYLEIENIFFYGFVSPKEAVCYRILAPYANQVSVSGNIGDTSKFMSPLKIFEYMSHKKAIICSDIPVLREVLSKKNSILVAADNSQEWIIAIEELRNKKIRNKLSFQALDDFHDRYSWKQRSEKVIEGMN